MEPRIYVKPLPYKTRQRTFGLLLTVFLVSLPFLYLYATGYRFDLEKPTNLVSTGGIYLAVDRTEAEIFIDNELVRETRTFRKAFYAQNLDAGTHRVHVQKNGYHTWVKELPVSKRRVTEAEAFNLPLVPQVRTLSPWHTATGSVVVSGFTLNASSTNVFLATTTTATSTFVRDQEFLTLKTRFASTSEELSRMNIKAEDAQDLISQSTTTDHTEEATSTIASGGVRLYKSGDDLFATWTGSFEEMPYYYCAPDFPVYTAPLGNEETMEPILEIVPEDEEVPVEEIGVIHPVQSIPKDTVCDPSIRIDRKWQTVRQFDFLPGTTDFVVVTLDTGIYVVEIDDRSWQNVQPLLVGNNLMFRIENGNIFVYDGVLIYQILLTAE